ncbi:MAG: hypothetical protein KatS3mg109_1351 [Pirellulaceae bacterium]|nr:MAG: hypothetical protein KatS3mg109_1213 [Pirellulaceae bacterium]GIW90919.1 MAG: hypothetical protein KatS3mg109_1351 [Pirellulaceae bacterium]
MLGISAIVWIALYILVMLGVLSWIYRTALKRRKRTRPSCSCSMCHVLIARAHRESAPLTPECPICGHWHWIKRLR